MTRWITLIALLAVAVLGNPALAEIERNPRSRSGDEPAESATTTTEGNMPPAAPIALGDPPSLLLTTGELAAAKVLAGGVQHCAAMLAQLAAAPATDMTAGEPAGMQPVKDTTAGAGRFTDFGEPATVQTETDAPVEMDPPAPTNDAAQEQLSVYSSGPDTPAASAQPDPAAPIHEPDTATAQDNPVTVEDLPIHDDTDAATVPDPKPEEATAAEPEVEPVNDPVEALVDEPAEQTSESTEDEPTAADTPPATGPAGDDGFRTTWVPRHELPTRTVEGTQRQLPEEKPQPQYSDHRPPAPAAPKPAAVIPDPVAADEVAPEPEPEETTVEPAEEPAQEDDGYPLAALLGIRSTDEQAASPGPEAVDPKPALEPAAPSEPVTAPAPVPVPELKRPAEPEPAPLPESAAGLKPLRPVLAPVAPTTPVRNFGPPSMPDYAVPADVTNISRGNPRRKQVALTFDDGPHPEFTSQLLAVLGHYDVPATFFFVGVQAQKYPHWVKMTHQAGHELASHTYDHFRLPKLPREEKVYQIDEYQRLIESLCGVTPRFLRPPGGQLDGETGRMLTDRGMVLALWDVAINDTKNGKTKDDTLNTALTNIRPGSVVLCHDGIQATVDMLPELITALREQGYEFVTMSELAAGL